jgi:hypothetical protein
MIPSKNPNHEDVVVGPHRFEVSSVTEIGGCSGDWERARSG